MKISLFKSIDHNMKLNAGIEVDDLEIIFNNQLEDDEITSIKISENSNIVLNELIPEWSPVDNELRVRQRFIITHPKYLFGENGITHKNNVLGLACHVYSKTSNFQKTILIDEIKYQETGFETEFEYYFPMMTLFGSIYFEFYIYLKDFKEPINNGADTVGINLCEEFLSSFRLIIDGEGSEFPIEEINDPEQPLWLVKLNWTDIFEDMFNSNSVRLILNQAHPQYPQLMNQRLKVNEHLMNEAIWSSIIMIIQQAIIVEKNEINEQANYAPGSLAQVIKYWIDVYKVDTDSLESISNSVRKNATKI